MQTPERFNGFACASRRRYWLVALVVALSVTPLFSHAATTSSNPLQYIPEIVIPNFAESGSTTVSGLTIGNYIRAVFIFFIWIVGILATVMITYGGIRWVAAAGNAGRINDARATINNALIGLVLALSSYALLYIINPDLTRFNSINPQDVFKQTLNLQTEVIQLAGEIPTCNGVGAVVGSPTTVCTSAGQCSETLNSWVINAAREFSTDPVLIKAIIMQESPKVTSAQAAANPAMHAGDPISGPGRVPERSGSTRLTSSYGLGQWTAATLLTIFPNITKDRTVPGVCNHTVAELRQPSGSLIPECAQWLEDHLQDQVRMVAYRLSAVRASACVGKSNTSAVLGYHLGDGDANNYCRGTTLQGTTAADLAVYIQQVSQKYEKICSASRQLFNPQGT